MAMRGIYRFYQNGQLIGEAENSLTETGRTLAIKTLTGALPALANTIGVGVHAKANTGSPLITDTDLSFRVSNTRIYGVNLDPSVTNDALVFKGRLEDPLSYKIYEVGLFSSQILNGPETYKNDTLFSFEPSDEFKRTVTEGTLDITESTYTASYSYPTHTALISSTDEDTFRIGDLALFIKAGQTVFSTIGWSGLETYSANDKLKIAYYAKGTVSGTISVVFTSNSSSKTYTFTESTTSAIYNVKELELGSPTSSSGTDFDWANVSKISLTTASRDFVLDGIRLERKVLVDSNIGMVSRAVLVTPIIKTNVPIDIEYYLTLGFNV